MMLPPGPPEAPPLQLLRWVREPIEFMTDCTRRYGEAYTVRLPRMKPFVVFSDPAAVKEIFATDPEDAFAGQANLVLRTILGPNSLLLLDGKRHIRERKLMMPPFHGERMRDYGVSMQETTARHLDALPLGQPFTVLALTQAITLDVVLATVFGLEGAEQAEMRGLLSRYTEAGTSPLGTILLLTTPADLAERLFTFGMDPVNVLGVSLDLGRFLPWATIVRAGRAVDDRLYAEIRQRRADALARSDVMSLLLAARDEDGQPMKDVELRDEMITLLLAGHETTATTLAWTVHFVLGHPDVHRRVVEEIDGVRGDRDLRVEDMAKLELLDAVIKESMRLMPIISMVGRRLQRPLTIGGWELDRGIGVAASVHMTHKNPRLWPDPSRFDPARFLGQRPAPYEFFPFGGGTRRCIGMAFASYEMRIVLAELFARLSVRRDGPDHVVPARRGISLAPKGGVRVVASRRAQR